MEEEIWATPPWYTYYQVSSIGNVKSFKNGRWWVWKERILKHWVTRGYHCVNLCKDWKSKNFQVSRLVALTFIPNKENKTDVNHKNGIKADNSIENLEWCTKSENILHAFKTGLKRATDNNHFKKNHPSKWKFWKYHHCARNINQYTKDGVFIKEWGSVIDATRELWIKNLSLISRCCLWKVKIAWGFIWKHVNYTIWKKRHKKKQWRDFWLKILHIWEINKENLEKKENLR